MQSSGFEVCHLGFNHAPKAHGRFSGGGRGVGQSPTTSLTFLRISLLIEQPDLIKINLNVA